MSQTISVPSLQLIKYSKSNSQQFANPKKNNVEKWLAFDMYASNTQI